MSAAKSAPQLTVALIVRDEADVLANTLTSVRAIADELIVVDTGSRDATRAIAAQHGATVIDFVWEEDFAAARNAALDAAQGQFVLWLDAGERLETTAVEPLRAFVENQAEANKLYGLTIDVPPPHLLAPRERIVRLRLMPRRPGLRFMGRVCESVAPAAAALGLENQLLPWRIMRTARDHRADVKTRRAQRNLALVERQAGETGLTPRLLITQAEAIGTLGDRASAALHYHQAVRQAPRGSLDMLEAYYGLLSALDFNPAHRERQLAICLEAVEIFPIDAQLLCVLGGYLQGQGRLDLAARSFRLAAEHGQVEPEVWHLADAGDLALSCLAATLELEGNDTGAVELLTAALLQPRPSKRLARMLLSLHVKHGRVDEALALVPEVADDLAARPLLRSAVRGASLAARQTWIPAWSYLRTAYEEGCRDPLCLRWLTVTMLSTGQTEAVQPILEEWRSVEPDNAEMQTYLRAIAAAEAELASGQTVQPSPSTIEPTPVATPRQIRVDSQSPIAPPPLPQHEIVREMGATELR